MTPEDIEVGRIYQHQIYPNYFYIGAGIHGGEGEFNNKQLVSIGEELNCDPGFMVQPYLSYPDFWKHIVPVKAKIRVICNNKIKVR